MANLKGNPKHGGRNFQLTLQTLTSTPTPLTIGPRTETQNPFNTIFGIANRNQYTLLKTKQLGIIAPQPTNHHKNPPLQQITPKLIKLATLNYQLKNTLAPPIRWIIR